MKLLTCICRRSMYSSIHNLNDQNHCGYMKHMLAWVARYFIFTLYSLNDASNMQFKLIYRLLECYFSIVVLFPLISDNLSWTHFLCHFLNKYKIISENLKMGFLGNIELLNTSSKAHATMLDIWNNVISVQIWCLTVSGKY
jgi:hypothetical protein